jgi:hypothetical protein
VNVARGAKCSTWSNASQHGAQLFHVEQFQLTNVSRGTIGLNWPTEICVLRCAIYDDDIAPAKSRFLIQPDEVRLRAGVGHVDRVGDLGGGRLVRVGGIDADPVTGWPGELDHFGGAITPQEVVL